MDIAVIPARGGSKRIPRKNIRLISGRPLLTWIIEVAQESALFERVIVSTDDDEIASVARAAGAEVPFSRAPELASDHAPLVSVVSDMANYLVGGRSNPEMVCCLLPAAVLTTTADLQGARTQLLQSSAAYCSAVVRFGHPIQRAFDLADGGRVAFIDEERAASRTQDLATRWHDGGQFYWGRVEAWCQGLPILPNAVGYEVPAWRAVDIDNEDDWQLAERLHGTR